VTRDRIESIVLDAMRATNAARTADQQLVVAPDAPIFGRHSTLDSLGLVALLIDVEDALAAEGVNVTLSDERAMSQSRSPFRDVPSLVAFIEGLLATPA
jgi:hypothetical protein